MNLNRLKHLAGILTEEKLSESLSDNQIKEILRVLGTSTFSRWYENQFKEYLDSRENEEKIIKDFKLMFRKAL